MGIPRGTARLLLDEARRRPLRGSLIQLGRSTIYLRRDELEHWAAVHDVTLASGVETQLSHDPRMAEQGCIDDRTFFALLGFDRIESCDISDWEGAEHIVDLNRPLPAELHERYDVVLDPGAGPQIFHQPQLMANLHTLTIPGGRVIHAALPSNNHVDFGFFMYSPAFFDQFYRANGWRLDTQLLCEYVSYWHRGRFLSGPWKIYRYRPGCLDAHRFGRIGARQLAVFVVATKLAEATADAIPMLASYVESWNHYERQLAPGEDGRDGGRAVAPGELPPASSAAGSPTAALGELLDRLPLGDRLYRPLKRWREHLRRLLPPKIPAELVGRY